VNSYLDVSICQYSIKTVLAELVRCLSLFPNLHTVQIDIISCSTNSNRICEKVFEQTFKKYSFPQIRNVFFMASTSLHLAHRHGASVWRNIGESPLTDRVCKLYWIIVLMWKYLKTLVKFFGHPILVNVRIFILCIFISLSALH
jgi:hypothetical protein